MQKTPTIFKARRSSRFLLFLSLSCLLHLVAGLLLLRQPLLPSDETKEERTPIALEQRKNWLELDQKPLEPALKPPEKATHLAQENQRVQKEAAPKGQDSRDRQPQQQVARQQKKQPSPPASRTRQSLPEKSTFNTRPDRYAALPERPAPAPERLDIPLELPKLTELTNLAPTTQARLDRQQKIKNRPEVELEDDAIWLNLQQMDNKLLSFFRRFHDKIEAVWNYPVEASSRGVEGTLLIRIVVNKKGELLDALPLETSGSDVLDYEAIQAVYRAAPFGKLPNYYPHDKLKIYAHFQYNLSRRMIYGRP